MRMIDVRAGRTGRTRRAGRTGHARRTGRAARAAVTAVLLAAALTGCLTEQGGVPGELSRAAAAASSAAATGELAVQAWRADRTTRTATDIALLDALARAQDAEVAAATLVVATSDESGLRDDALAAIHRGTQAVTAARAWLSTTQAADGTGADAATADQVEQDLATSADELSDLADRLEAAS